PPGTFRGTPLLAATAEVAPHRRSPPPRDARPSAAGLRRAAAGLRQGSGRAPAGLRQGSGGRVRRALGGKLAHSLRELRPTAASHPLGMPDPARGPTPSACPSLSVVQRPRAPRP